MKDEKSRIFSLIWNTGCASEMKASGGSQLTDAERADFAALTERRGGLDYFIYETAAEAV